MVVLFEVAKLSDFKNYGVEENQVYLIMTNAIKKD